MAYHTNGILGPITGKVGPVVGLQWRGKSILRAAPQKNNKKASEKQLAQRAKMTLASQFIAPCKALISQLCTVKVGGKTAVEAALSNLLKKALYSEGDQVYIRYNKVIFTFGYLPGVHHTKLFLNDKQEVELQWMDNSNNGLTEEEDRLTVLLYHQESGVYYHYPRCAMRKAKHVKLELPLDVKPGTMQAWTVWTDETNTSNSTSSYVGMMAV